jgi:hypothetical protein
VFFSIFGFTYFSILSIITWVMKFLLPFIPWYWFF